jgi:hypothetical protein
MPTNTQTNPTPVVSSKGQSAVDIASRYIGLIPYRLGAGVVSTRTLTAADCSSFVQFVYGQLGYSLPKAADAQYKATAATQIKSPAVANLKPGDLLFFGGWNTPDNPPGYAGIQHVGIYAGNGFVIDEGGAVANNVGTAKLSNYGTHLLAATRPLNPSSATATNSGVTADVATVSDPIQKWATNSTDTFTAADKLALIQALQSSGIPNTYRTQLATTAQLDTLLNPIVGKTYSDAATQSAITEAVKAAGFTTGVNYTPSTTNFTQDDFNAFVISGKLGGLSPENEATIISTLKPYLGKAWTDSSFVAAINKIYKMMDPGFDPLGIGGIAGAIGNIAGLLGKFTNPANWQHLGAMLIGVGLVGFGLYMGSKDLGESGPQGLVSPMPIILKEGA